MISVAVRYSLPNIWRIIDQAGNPAGTQQATWHERPEVEIFFLVGLLKFSTDDTL